MRQVGLFDYQIYTDGKYVDSPKGRGAWGYCILQDENMIRKDSAAIEIADGKKSSLQQMRLIAIVNAINGLNEIRANVLTPFRVIVNTPCPDIIKCCGERWYDTWFINGFRTSKRKQVKNEDLWRAIIPYFNNADFVFNRTPKIKDDGDNDYYAVYVYELVKKTMLGGR